MSNVDLSQLSVDRDADTGANFMSVRRRWLSRYVLPATLLLMFVCLLGWAARDSFLPSKQVSVVPVIVSRAPVQQQGSTLFQAAGWIEPRPMPIVVSSLTKGVIQELNVVAGQTMKENEVIARLIDVDARIALAEARADLTLRDADIAAAEAELANANAAFANPVQLRADLASAESELAQVEGTLNGFPAAIEAAIKKQQLASEDVEKKLNAGNALAGHNLLTAKATLAGADATLQSLRAREPVLKRQLAAVVQKRDALAEKLELKLDEKRRVADAVAGLAAAKARHERARLAVETAELRLTRMTVRSPIAGRILAVKTAPGQEVSSHGSHSKQGANAVVTMYDPNQLQVRVDVRLEDVPQVQLGQKAQIETASLDKRLTGEVISVTSAADIRKNTLQVKVAIANPPEVIRPEMLAHVEFLAPEREKKGEVALEPLRLLIPRHLVAGPEGAAHVWVADQQSNVAKRRSIKLGRAGTDDLVEVVRGLTPTDKLIAHGRESLRDNDRIRIASEEATPTRR